MAIPANQSIADFFDFLAVVIPWCCCSLAPNSLIHGLRPGLCDEVGNLVRPQMSMSPYDLLHDSVRDINGLSMGCGLCSEFPLDILMKAFLLTSGLASISLASARTFTVYNGCPFTIWYVPSDAIEFVICTNISSRPAV